MSIRRFATVDQSGFLTGFYSDDVMPYSKIPSSAFLISDSVWLDWLANQRTRIWVGDHLIEYTPAPPPPFVPESITAFQAKAMLMQMAGSTPGTTKLAEIDAALNANANTPEGSYALLAWNTATSYTRSGNLINALGATFGFDSADLDALFIQAAQISA